MPAQATFSDVIADQLAMFDPVYFIEKYLRLDGKPYRINKNGYKPLSDIARYIGIKALERQDSKPVVILKSRQIGMTTLAAALEMFFMGSGLFGRGSRPPVRIIHTFPQLELAAYFGKVKLASIINDSVVPDEQMAKPGKQQKKTYMQLLLDGASTSDSMGFKQFIGGNHLSIESMGLDAPRLRGKTADIMFIDEVQENSEAALGNALKVLNQSNYGAVGKGVQVYFGTPRNRGSAFWDMWNKSSQQYFYLGCEKCKKHFPFYTPGSDDWEKTWIYGQMVRCSFCGFDQDKRSAVENGKWVGRVDASDCPYVGFHLNQLFMPHITKENLLAERPGVSSINTEKTYQNEVLGEFYHGEATIITPDQIREICGDPERKFSANILSSEEATVFLGLDWGARGDLEQLADKEKLRGQGQSFSTAVVVSMTGPQRMSIEFATKFKRNDLQTKVSLVEELMRKYSVSLAVGDLGYSNDLSEILQNKFGDKFLTSRASARVNDKAKFDGEAFPKVITFERDWWIANLYEFMKKGAVRFPMGSYEQLAWLIQHCCSMEIKPSISRTGDVSPHYVKGGAPNDGFMALLNAYIAYKFYVSDGLRIKNPAEHKEIGTKQEVPIISAYMPNFWKTKGRK
jgi:hypothetical protein